MRLFIPSGPQAFPSGSDDNIFCISDSFSVMDSRLLVISYGLAVGNGAGGSTNRVWSRSKLFSMFAFSISSSIIKPSC